MSNTPQPSNTPRSTNTPFPTRIPLGSRTNPFTGTGEIRDGRFQVNSIQRNMSRAVEQMNMFNTDPDSGEEWVIANVTFRCNLPADRTCNTSAILFEMVGKNNEIYRPEPLTVIDNAFGGEVFGGGEITGNVAYIIESSDEDLRVIINDWGTRTYFTIPSNSSAPNPVMTSSTSFVESVDSIPIPINSSSFSSSMNTTTPLQLTSVPVLADTPYIIISNRDTINARSCASTDCEVVTQLPSGSIISVIGITMGEEINGSRDWFGIDFDNNLAYIHSSLVRPVTQVSPTSQLASTQTATLEEQVSCNADFERLGANYRISNSYRGARYQIYSYVPIFETGFPITYSLEVGPEWTNPPFPQRQEYLTYTIHTINVDGVGVDYHFEGDIGIEESLFFSFEYADIKFSGWIQVLDIDAGPHLDSEMLDDMRQFIRAVLRRCEA